MTIGDILLESPKELGAPRVYLAGPDVFLPNPVARGATLKAICTAHGLQGVFPLDALDHEPAAWAALPLWQQIALRNEAHIRSCAALVANLTPFRGPSADVGTVFELGFMRALGRPVFGWSNCFDRFEARTRAGFPAIDGRDREGLAMESFGCVDNLMIDGAIVASGATLELENAADRWGSLAAFARSVAACAALLQTMPVRGP